MINLWLNRSGLVLYFVVAAVLMVFTFAALILGIMSSQSKFSMHKASRTQAYYAAQAAVNYAIEKLRLNDPAWNSAGTIIKTMCRTGPCDIVDTSFPPSIQSITITVGDLGSGLKNTRQITALVNYK